MQPADAATIARHRFPEHDADPVDLEAYAGWVAGKWTDGTYLGLLAISDAQVIAGAGLVLLDWGPTRGDPHPVRGRIVNVYTEPGWRRLGLARRLTTALLAEATARDVQTVGLGSSDAARGLYLSLGFRVQEREMMWRAPGDHPAP